MTARLEQKLAGMLNMGEDDVSRSLTEFIAEIRRRTEDGERVTIPRLGSFEVVDGSLAFEPDAEIESYVNAEFSGLTPMPVSPEIADRLRQTLEGAPVSVDAGGEETSDEDHVEESERDETDKPVADDDPSSEIEGVWTERIDTSHVDANLGSAAEEEADFIVVEGSGRDAEELAVLQALGGNIPDPKNEVPAPSINEIQEEIPDSRDETSVDDTPVESVLTTNAGAGKSEEEKAEEIEKELKRSERLKGIHEDARKVRRESKKQRRKKEKTLRRVALIVFAVVLIGAVGYWLVRGLMGGQSPAVDLRQDRPESATVLVHPEEEADLVSSEDSASTNIAVADTSTGDSSAATSDEETVAEPAPQAARSAIPQSEGNYAWIVGSSPNRALAERALKRYTDAGVSGELVEATVNGRTVFRVAIGRYRSADAATAGRSNFPDFAPSDMWIRNIGPRN